MSTKEKKIISAIFVKGVVGECKELEKDIPQIAFIGRSNVGKSSVINSLTSQNNLARTSSLPGRTQEINLYLINNSLYLLDLPGYGFVKSSPQAQEYLSRLVNWYLFTSGYEQRLVVLIIDAEVGPTASDLEILQSLEKYRKNIVIVCNKVDKIKKTNYKKQMEKIKDKLSSHVIIPYSTKNKIGVGGLLYEIFLD